MDAYRECQQSAQREHDEAVAEAKAPVTGEGDLPRALSWLGAFGSITFLPLLVSFMTAARRSAMTAVPHTGGAR
jgi:hypothetical protein